MFEWRLLFSLMMFSFVSSQQQPNIIFLFADDLGWNDVSFHGSPQIPTPNIDALAMSGILLNNYYSEWMCTPSRAALLTGKYPIRLGLQHYALLPGEASGLPLNETTLAQRLQGLGYATHMIGKWHLGYQTNAYTPTYRGFDTYFGYFNGFIDYYDYTHYATTDLDRKPWYYGIDWQNGTTPVREHRGEYATRVFTKKALDLIEDHDTSKPMFLFFAHLAVHMSNPYYPVQAPAETIAKFGYIDDPKRRTFAATMTELDDSVGQVFNALYQKGMLENSIVFFISDNGAEKQHDGRGSNWPLRGSKETLWEGGVHLPATIWSPLFNLTKPRISKQLMHVTDLCPTIYRAAGGDPSVMTDIDGIDMWDTLTQDLPSPRTNLLYNIDPTYPVAAYRNEHMKVINGTSIDENSWYGLSGYEDGTPDSMEQWVFKDGSVVRDVMKEGGWWIMDQPDNWYDQTKLVCQQPPPDNSTDCDPSVQPCLFNVTADPCEYYNLADTYPEVVDDLMSAIFEYMKVEVKPQSKPSDPNADPTCHNFTYVIWNDPQNFVYCNVSELTSETI